MQEGQNSGQVRAGGAPSSILCHNFELIISIDNLLCAWREFVKSKRNKRDVQEFELHLMDNLIELHNELADHSYCHDSYHHFKICDPKPRDIHKASVRDRLLHHAIHRQLYPYFNKKFVADSFSCRMNKGTHKAMDRFKSLAYKVSKNHTRTCWVLKCDIRKFFASIDHAILKKILARNISNQDTLWLLNNVVESFSTEGKVDTGLPLGNLTSQLLVNIYMNEFDQFVKRTLKIKHYIRYSDDFVILLDDRESLVSLIEPIKEFLESNLALTLHSDKLFLKTLTSGIDFLGWVHFSDHRVLRTNTKKRMLRNLADRQPSEATVSSYLGMLKWGRTDKIKQTLANMRSIW